MSLKSEQVEEFKDYVWKRGSRLGLRGVFFCLVSGMWECKEGWKEAWNLLAEYLRSKGYFVELALSLDGSVLFVIVAKGDNWTIIKVPNASLYSWGQEANLRYTLLYPASQGDPEACYELVGIFLSSIDIAFAL